MMRQVVLITTFGLVAAGLRAETPVDRLLRHLPDEAALLVVTPNAGKLVEGVAAFGQAAGLDDLAYTELHDVLRACAVEELTGLDQEGAWAMAWVPSRPAPLCLGLFKDEDAWLKAAGATPLEPGLWSVKIADTPATAATCEGLLLFSDDEEIVRAALASKGRAAARFGPVFARWAQTHQVTLGVRAEPWMPLLTPAMRMVQASLQMGMAMSGQQDEASLAFLNRLFIEVGEVLGQVNLYVAAVDASAQGVSVHDLVSFKPDSPAAAYLRKIRPAGSSLLRGLIDEECLGVIAWEWQAEPGTSSLTARLMERLLEEQATQQKLGPEKIRRGLEAIRGVHDNITGSNVAVVLDPPDVGMTFYGAYFTAQREKVLVNMRRSYELGPEFMGLNFGYGGTVKMACREESLDDAQAQVFEMRFACDDPQAMQMIKAMYGQEAFVTRSIMGGPGVLFASGPKALACERLRRMRTGAGRPLADNPRVVEACGRISPHPQFLLLLDLTRAFELAMRAACCTGAPVPDVKLPKDRGPFVVMGGYANGAKLRGELFVPARPIRILVDALEAAKRTEGDY